VLQCFVDGDCSCLGRLLHPLALLLPLFLCFACRYLLDAGDANVNVKNALGDTALMVAASLPQHRSSVRLLLSENADVNEQNLSGKTALMIATAAGLLKTAALLLEGGRSCADVPSPYSYRLGGGLFCPVVLAP
jgi:ankyrin repeat protein